MQDKLLFVQFLHPGVEHRPCHISNKQKAYHICWNTGEHKRKFIKNSGTYLENNDPKDSDLVFWGEWEPQSDVLQHFDERREGYPKYLYQPYYSIPHNQKGLQNTDPFVFGKQFHYVCCRQTKKIPKKQTYQYTQLKWLTKGSVILFGSRLNNKFILDTVFVVKDYKDISSLKEGENFVHPIYTDVTLSQLFDNQCNQLSDYSCFSNLPLRLYFGATYQDPLEGMFSFFPCLPYQKCVTNGFVRPHISLQNIIPEELPKGFNQGFKYEFPNLDNTIEIHKALWNQVKQQVENRGLKLGVYTELPQKK